MGRPFRTYCMSLVERLGLGTLANLYMQMSSNDIVDWMAYDLTQDTEWRKSYNDARLMQEQKTQTLEEEADRMRAMLMGLSR